MHDKMTIGSIVQLTETGVEQRIDFMGEITRRFAEVSQRQMEAGLRKKLIELGWTPPGAMDANVVEDERVGTYHSAIDDAKHQARHLIKMVRRA